MKSRRQPTRRGLSIAVTPHRIPSVSTWGYMYTESSS